MLDINCPGLDFRLYVNRVQLWCSLHSFKSLGKECNRLADDGALGSNLGTVFIKFGDLAFVMLDVRDQVSDLTVFGEALKRDDDLGCAGCMWDRDCLYEGPWRLLL